MGDDGPRRLSAVMLTDLVGYTALTQKDEALALRVLEAHRAILRPLFERHHGREVKTIGDAFLVEFESALDATQGAIDIQRALRQSQPGASADRIDLRVGIHVGDVVHKDGDVYGDAVNIVSRIEPLAEPGGVCISQTVFDQVRNKIDYPLKKLAAPQLKNVLFPVDVYRVEMPWSPKPGFGTPWVGRGSEMAQLERAIERAARRESSVVFVAGEAGIGKSRLVEEAIEVAGKKGFQVLRGRCVRAELAAPYGPWSEAIRSFVRAAPNQQVYKACGNYANEIAKLVPELAERLGQVPPPVGGDPDQARLRFYEGITQFFANVAQDAPLLLSFDDLHWGDAPTLRLFAYAARGLRGRPVLLIGALESPEEGAEGPLPELLRDLRRERLGETVTLARFSPEQVGELVAAMFGEAEISDEFRQLLYDRTSGNPFYLTETLRALIDEGAVYRTPEGRWERKEIAEIKVPKTVREAIRERFNRLDKDVQETVRTASVLGTTFNADVLRALVNADEETLIDRLEKAVEARIVREEPASTRSLDFSFTDAQVRDLLYGEMLAIRRARYHRQAAEAIEKLAKGRTDAVAADLAHHYREGHEAEKARNYSVLAGDSAKNVFAFDEAERQYGVALELLREVPDVGLEAHVLAGLGDLHQARGRPHLSVGEWDSAIRLFARAKNPHRAGVLTVRLADLLRLNPELTSVAPRGVDELLESGRKLLEAAPPSEELADLYDMFAVWLLDKARIEEAREMIERGLRLARGLGNKRVEMAMMDELAMVAPPEERDTVFDYLTAKAEFFSQPETLDLTQYAWSAGNLARAYQHIRSDTENAARWFEKATDAHQRMHNLGEEVRMRLGYLAGDLLPAGDVAGAEAQLERSRKLVDLSGKPFRFAYERAQARLDLVKGDLVSARRHADALLELARDRAVVSMTILVGALDSSAEVHLAEGKSDLAVRELREALELSRDEARRALRARARIARLALLAEALLAGTDSGEHLAELEQIGRDVHELASALGNPYGLGVDRRLQARLAHRAGRAPEALARLDESISLFQRAGNPFELGRALRLKARILRDLGETERAAASLHEALEILARIGASGEAKGVEAEIGEHRAVPATSSPAQGS